MSLKFNVSPAGFSWLSQAFNQTTPISPLNLFKGFATEYEDSVVKDLISQNVIADDGTIQPGALASLNLLAQADAYSRVRILGTLAPVDKVTYFKSDVSCSVDSGSGAFEVAFPAMTKEAGYVLEEFTGSSRLINAPFTATLPLQESLALLALVDLVRSRSLLALGGEKRDFSFTPEEVLAKANGQEGYISFVRSMKDLAQISSLSHEEGLAALRSLVDKGFAVEREGRYAACGDALSLATTHLIPEYVFNISYGRLVSVSEVEKSECNVVFSGMHNLLYMELDGEDKVSMETMSGSDLLGILISALSIAPTAL
jgi:hypothetical protein